MLSLPSRHSPFARKPLQPLRGPEFVERLIVLAPVAGATTRHDVALLVRAAPYHRRQVVELALVYRWHPVAVETVLGRFSPEHMAWRELQRDIPAAVPLYGVS
jgi:hypothetical protein